MLPAKRKGSYIQHSGDWSCGAQKADMENKEVIDMDKETHTNNTNTTIEKTKSRMTEKSIRLTSGDSEIVFVSNDKDDSIKDMSDHAERLLRKIDKRIDVDYIG